MIHALRIALAAADDGICTPSYSNIDGVINFTGYCGGNNTSNTPGNQVIFPKDVTSLVDLTITNDGDLLTLSAPALTSINNFSLSNAANLSFINFPQLKDIVALEFASIGNPKGVGEWNITGLTHVSISDTALPNLDWIDLGTLKYFSLLRNPQISSLESSATSMNGEIIVQENADNFVANFPSLVNASQISFTRVTNVSLPALERIVNGLSVTSSPLTNLSMPQLTMTGDITFTDNNMSRLEIPQLTVSNASIVVINNTGPRNVSLPKLETVQGSILIYGELQNVSSVSFPSLKQVTGDVYVNGSSNLNCSSLQTLATSGAVGGNVTCAGTVLRASTREATGLDTGAKAGIAVGVAVPVLMAVVGGALWWRRRKRPGRAYQPAPAVSPDSTPAPAPAISEKPELHGHSSAHVMYRQEIDGQGLSQLDAGPRSPVELHGRAMESEVDDSGLRTGSRNVLRGHGQLQDPRFELA
ncbi:hypothetical protein E8E14_006684 [Neopestalotiopsis sp. 37M]|nr:hypothetical protein E8E14_006684 [Neopestalotiopsis sp. 37M]